jgi:hypothetical protein
MPSPVTLPWPIVTLDLEASSLAPESYPIEIGVAQWQGPGSPIFTWSRLIRPVDAWVARDPWNAQTQLVHGIRPEQLEDGEEPDDIVELLNQRHTPGTLAYCDGGEHDQRWFDTLLSQSSIGAHLKLRSWADLIRPMGYLPRVRLEHWTDTNRPIHRAGPDAVDHLRGLAFAIEAPEPSVLPWPGDA